MMENPGPLKVAALDELNLLSKQGTMVDVSMSPTMAYFIWDALCRSLDEYPSDSPDYIAVTAMLSLLEVEMGKMSPKFFALFRHKAEWCKLSHAERQMALQRWAEESGDETKIPERN